MISWQIRLRLIIIHDLLSIFLFFEKIKGTMIRLTTSDLRSEYVLFVYRSL